MPFVTFCRNTTRRRSRWRSPGGLARGSNFIFRAKSHLDPTRFSSRLRNPLFPLLFSFFSTLRPFFSRSFVRLFVSEQRNVGGRDASYILMPFALWNAVKPLLQF